MTDGKISVRELLEKGSDATFLREMIGFGRERPQGHLSRGQRPVGFPQFGQVVCSSSLLFISKLA
jgi:hypothetical protein